MGSDRTSVAGVMTKKHKKKRPVWQAFGAVLIIFAFQPMANAQDRAVDECQRITELEARLACFDRVFPPIDESPADEPDQPADVQVVSEAEPIPQPAQVSPEPTPAPAVAEAEPQTESRPEHSSRFTLQSRSSIAEIVSIEQPSVSATLFHASDGRVFARERARVQYHWPEPPFDVEVQMSRFGGYFLKMPNGVRVRVAVRD